MQEIDSNIYKKMEELKKSLAESNEKMEKNKQTKLKDILYLGSIDWIEVDSIGIEVKIKKDIYVSIEENSLNNSVTKYYDENNELIAIDLYNINKIVPTSKYILNNDNGKAIKEKLKNLNFENGLSLNQINQELDKLSESLNIPKEQILSISQSEYTEKNKKEEKIELKNKNASKEKTQEKTSSKDNSSKNNPNIKQETDLSQKINDRYTLGDILGVPNDGKLVVVYSSAVKDNTNSTRFTFLIQDKDGNFMPCHNLEQVAGNTPKNNVYASNYNGDTVNKEQVNSMYKIKSPYSSEGYVLTADIGSLGTIDLGLGQIPKMKGINTSNTSIVTSPLKTTSTYNIRPDLKETLHSYHNGKYQPDLQSKEADSHKDCKLTKDEVDGDLTTGEQHLSKEEMIEIIDKIHLYESKNTEYSSRESLLNELIHTYLHGNDYPSKEEFLKACSECEREHTRTQTP